jgi:hypothetical protein
MKFHELANIFPMLGDEELAELCADIKKNGLAEPITVYEGKILDGRNRATACTMLGVSPKTVEYTGDDPVAFVLSKNLHRRHLTESQRALVASKLATLPAHRPTVENKCANLRTYSQDAGNKGITAQSGAVPQAEAAKMLNVSKRQVQNATKLRKEVVAVNEFSDAFEKPLVRGEESVYSEDRTVWMVRFPNRESLCNQTIAKCPFLTKEVSEKRRLLQFDTHEAIDDLVFFIVPCFGAICRK